ncbi:MAG: MFS transporter [Microbacterium sp.]
MGRSPRRRGRILPRGHDGAARWWGLVVVSLAQVMVVLDTTVINVALPSIQREMGLGVGGRQWVVTAYVLAFGASLLPGGRLGDLWGRRRVLVIAATGFAVASIVGGLAADGVTLVLARTAQGLFAGSLAPSTLALLSTTFTDQKRRATAFSIFSTAAMSGAAAGLILGGVLTEFADWRWCLFINAPIAALAIVGALLVLPRSEPGGGRFDIPGALLGPLGAAALVLALAQAGSASWTSPVVLGALIAAAVLLVAFAVTESRTRDPLLPPAIFADRQRIGAFFSIAAIAFGALGMFLFATLLMQDVEGYSALRAGIAFLPYVLANALVASQLVRRLQPRLPPSTLIVPGLLLMATALLLLGQSAAGTGYLPWLLPATVAAGLGVGLVAGPAMSLGTRGPHPGVASAFVGASQQLGGSLGTAVLNSIAAAVTVSSLETHPARAHAAEVHAITTASLAGAGVLAAAAIIAGLLTRAPRPASTRT